MFNNKDSIVFFQSFYFELKDWCADGDGTMTLEAASDDCEDIFSNCHLKRVIVTSALREKHKQHSHTGTR